MWQIVATWNVGTWPHCHVPYFHVAMWPYALIHVATWSCVLIPRSHVATCTNPTCPGSHMVIWACWWYNQQRGHLDHVVIWPRGYSNGYCSHMVIWMNFCSDDFGFFGKGDLRNWGTKRHQSWATRMIRFGKNFATKVGSSEFLHLATK
jgi:hypothetical protein